MAAPICYRRLADVKEHLREEHGVDPKVPFCVPLSVCLSLCAFLCVPLRASLCLSDEHGVALKDVKDGQFWQRYRVRTQDGLLQKYAPPNRIQLYGLSS